MFSQGTGNFSGVMETEPVQYIWSTFGGVLTEALAEVYLAKPNNPIYYLAHCLVKQMYVRFGLTDLNSG